MLCKKLCRHARNKGTHHLHNKRLTLFFFITAAAVTKLYNKRLTQVQASLFKDVLQKYIASLLHPPQRYLRNVLHDPSCAFLTPRHAPRTSYSDKKNPRSGQHDDLSRLDAC